jgi:hypothetical protein
MQDQMDSDDSVYPDEFGKILEDPERVRKVESLFLAATDVYGMDWLYAFEYAGAHLN